MDIFGTTVTVLHEIYNITVFIKGVVDDVKLYDSDIDEIRLKLRHEFVFVDTFRSLFFEDPTSEEVYKTHSKMLQEDVQSILHSLKRVLAEYGNEARKHGILPDKAGDDKETAGKVANKSQPEVHHHMGDFIGRIRSKAKDWKLKAIDWSLFEKDNILNMLAAYSEWTARLRQNMALMTQTMQLKGLIPGEFAKSQQAKDLGLQDVVTRQMQAQSVPDDFTSLDAMIVEGSERRITAGVTVARFEAARLNEAKEYVIEQRTYDKALQQAIDSKDKTKVQDLKSDLRKLAWLLHEARSTEETDDTEVVAAKKPVLLTLRCLGYIDQPENGQMQFIYEPPELGPLDRKLSITTLHSFIMGIETQTFTYKPSFLGLWQDSWSGSSAKRNTWIMPKPSLRNRFFLAQALALTVLNIHNSGWVHKNLWSHGIIIIPSMNRSSRNGSPCFVPYVAGWEVARSSSATATELRPDYSIESNLYRHPARQQKPSNQYVFLHDIYSLGVLLLEIGLWNTAINIFQNEIERAVRRRAAPSVKLVQEKWTNSLKTSVQREMGDVYAEAVNCCLMGTFGLEKDGATETDLPIRFTKLVIDAIRPGLSL